MRIKLKSLLEKILQCVRLLPLSLAGKCRVAFGAAVIFILALALYVPYVWMGHLTKNTFLKACRAKSETLLSNHFRLTRSSETGLAMLDNSGAVMDSNDIEIRWISFANESKEQVQPLSDEQKDLLESLKEQEIRDDGMIWAQKHGVPVSNYIRIFRAGDTCISCHNAQGSARAFSQNELIGAAVIERPARELGRIVLINRVGTLVAALFGGAGAIVVFYWITQRVILRPIRQLRALANNVAEGNLDIRSSIRTGDEYEKLATAFNHMLDELQTGQEKLRQANKKLDEKIAELSERNIELFRANKLKSEFVANISHEVRTPLNAILGFAEILREKPEVLKKEKGQRYVENIISGGKNLLNMINDLLDLAKSEAGKMQLHVEETSLSELCKSLVASFSALTKRKKVKVRLIVADDIPALVTDGGKVRQILYNFLSNAVKFTSERGRIEIRAEMRDEKMVRISVIDTGCGIAEADEEKIFEKFRQADGSITRKSAGSGLGLAISKELAVMLAGSVGMNSELNKGSTFWLDIPVVLTKSAGQVSEQQTTFAKTAQNKRPGTGS